VATLKVFKSECATSDEVHAWISAKTDGYTVCISEPVDRGDYWEFETCSTQVSPPPGNIFPDNNCSSDTNIERQIHQFDERPEFDSVGPAPDAAFWTPGVATDLGNPDAKPVEEPVAAELKQHNDDLEKLLERMKPYR